MRTVPANPQSAMKLSGLRVVDLTVFFPGPYLTQALADHGAEVIKVEAPGEGDPIRHIGIADGPSSVYFRGLNRGKKSVVLDLKDSVQRETLLTLCETADVFVEAFRPGVVGRLGVGYEQVRARNPRIVYCSISAYGQTGPNRERPSHDLGLQAESGVLSMSRGTDGRPIMPGIPVADVVSGLQGLAGVLMALLRRETSGEGDYVDIAMYDAMLAAVPDLPAHALAETDPSVEEDGRSTGGAAFYQVYETSDGGHVVLAGQEMKFVRNLLNALDRPEFIDLCARGPGPHQQPVIALLSGFFATKTKSQCLAWLAAQDVCYGGVNSPAEALNDPHLLARGMVLTDATGRRHIGSPIHFANEPAVLRLQEPGLNAHAAEVLGKEKQA